MKHRTATVIGVLLALTHPLECAILRIVHWLSKRASKLSNFLDKGTPRRDDRVAINMCCRLINVYRTHHQPNVTSGEACQKIEGSVKQISGT
jgi:hypothetical protein